MKKPGVLPRLFSLGPRPGCREIRVLRRPGPRVLGVILAFLASPRSFRQVSGPGHRRGLGNLGRSLLQKTTILGPLHPTGARGFRLSRRASRMLRKRQHDFIFRLSAQIYPAAVLYDRVQVFAALQDADVIQWVGVQDQQVGQFAGLDHAQFTLHAH